MTKKKSHKFNRLIILISIALALLFGLVCAVAYYINDGSAGGNHQSTASDSSAQITAGEEDSDGEIFFKPYKAVETERSAQVPLSVVFGSAYSENGGGLYLLPDGTFTLYAGVGKEEEQTGTYKAENDVITISFQNGDTLDLTVSENENGKKEVAVQYGLYLVYFEMQA